MPTSQTSFPKYLQDLEGVNEEYRKFFSVLPKEKDGWDHICTSTKVFVHSQEQFKV